MWKPERTQVGQVGGTTVPRWVAKTELQSEDVFFFFVFCLFRAALKAYRGSQARGPVGAVAAGLCHSHSNTGSQPHL